jgi:hypothetical protein
VYLDVILSGKKRSLGQQKVPNRWQNYQGLSRDAAQICRNNLANESNRCVVFCMCCQPAYVVVFWRRQYSYTTSCKDAGRTRYSCSLLLPVLLPWRNVVAVPWIRGHMLLYSQWIILSRTLVAPWHSVQVCMCQLCTCTLDYLNLKNPLFYCTAPYSCLGFYTDIYFLWIFGALQFSVFRFINTF